MKYFKKIVCALLCASMLFTVVACGKGNGDDSDALTYGRYVEKDITPDGMIGSPSNLVSFGDGTIDLISLLYDYEKEDSLPEYHRYRTENSGESWKELDMQWVDEYQSVGNSLGKGEGPDEVQGINQMFPLENGDILALVYYYLQSTGENSTNAIRVTPEGEVSKFTFPIIEELGRDGTFRVNYYLTAMTKNCVFMEAYAQKKAPPGEEGKMNYNEDDFKQVRGVFSLETGEIIYEFPKDTWTNWFNNDQYLFFPEQYDSSLFTVIDLKTGAPASVKTPSPQFLNQLGFNGMYNTFIDEDNNFFTVNNRGMQKIGVDMDAPETVMDGINYSYGSPLSYVQYMQYMQDGTVLLALDMQDEYGKLLSYKYDEKAVATSKKSISVYSLYDSDTVRLALSEYKRLHPEVMVEYETPFSSNDDDMIMYSSMGGMTGGAAPASSGAGGDEGLTEEDALRALNAAILGGDGPDVMILDNLPMESFIEQGVLEDLSGLLEGVDVYSQVMEPFKAGGMYAIPTRFSMPLLLGEQGDVEGYTDFDALVSAIVNGPSVPVREELDWENATQEQHEEYYRKQNMPTPKEERPILLFGTQEDVANTFYEICAPAIFSQKQGIDRDALIKYLQAVKSVSEKYELLETEGSSAGFGSSVSFSGAMGMSRRMSRNSFSESMYQFASKKSLFGYSQFNGFNVLDNLSSNVFYNSTRMAASYDDDGKPLDGDGNIIKPDVMKVNAVSAPGLSSGVYYPMLIAGVSTAAKRPELAKDFVATLLTENIQKYDMGEGLPVTKGGFAAQSKKYEKLDSYQVKQGFEKVTLAYDELFSGIETPYFMNQYLQNVIMQGLNNYCYDVKSLEEAADYIISETELYFAERQ